MRIITDNDNAIPVEVLYWCADIEVNFELFKEIDISKLLSNQIQVKHKHIDFIRSFNSP
jgi:hypothetical protein